MPNPAPMERFTDAVRAWFLSEFEAPTPVQAEAWDAIQDGKNVLAIAPTGSGKTLAAFLAAIDRLVAAPPSPAEPGVRILYVSPMKALAADVEKNLRRPLASIADAAAALGSPICAPSTAMRTGDTSPAERRRIASKPSQILITTPESLYLMLTSKASRALTRVETVIVDELHSLAGSKRGAHLALSLERLDCLLESPAQRVGLSATVRPPERVARFLGGSRPVEVVGAGATPDLDLSVEVPVPDMARVAALSVRAAEHGSSTPSKDAWKTDRTMAAAMKDNGRRGAGPTKGLPRESRVGSRSIWPHLEAKVLDLVEAHSSTIVFVNSRGLCERLCTRLNELYAQRHGLAPVAPAAAERAFHSAMGSAAEHGQPLPDDFVPVARAHHGSMSKERRAEVEAQLKAGGLRCVVATSSLELGIDMGSVDLVVQVAPPLSVAGGLQRAGRANHSVGGRSRAVMFPRTRLELVDCAVAAEAMEAGAIEETRLVANPLDVLAQQTVAAVSQRPWKAADWFCCVRKAENYRELPRAAFDAVLSMLAGDFSSTGLEALSPRLAWDRQTDELTALPNSQNLAVSGAGTIPDRGLYPVFVEKGRSGRERRRVGELDEEMVHESRVGDVITLGTSTWRIKRIHDDRVLVEHTGARASRLPFWHGEGTGRPFEDGLVKGEFLDAAAAGTHQERPDEALEKRLAAAGLSREAGRNLCALLAQQRASTGAVPGASRLVMEYVNDNEGDLRLVLHSPFGRSVHAPWALAVADRVKRRYGFDPQVMAADDGIVLRMQPTDDLPGPELFVFDSDVLGQTVRSCVADTALFSARFRECAARALLMRPAGFGKRAPLWLQRVQGGQLLEAARRCDGFPILLEAMRECLLDVYDLPALEQVQQRLRSRSLAVTVAHTATPSPFAANLLFGYVMEHLYDDDRPRAEKAADLLSIDPALLAELVGTDDIASLVPPEVTAEVEAELQWLAPGFKATCESDLERMLRRLGPLSDRNLAERCDPAASAVPWLAALADARHVFRGVVAGQVRWIARSDAVALAEALGVAVPDWAAAERESFEGFAGAEAKTSHLGPLDGLVSRFAACHGPFSAGEVARFLGCGPAVAAESVARLARDGILLQAPFGRNDQGEEKGFVAASVFRRMRARARKRAAGEAAPVDGATFTASLLARQQVPCAGEETGDPVDVLADAVALFEGVFLPPETWEEIVFPSRVPGYRPSMLDELLASGDVVWQGKLAGDKDGERRRLSAFWPTDSPFAPLPAQGQAAVPFRPESVGGHMAKAQVWEVLAQEGPTAFAVVNARCEQAAGGAAAVADALEALLWDGVCLVDSFDPARANKSGAAPAPKRRSHSRYRGRAARRAARAFLETPVTAAAAATSGRWSVACAADVSDTERACTHVESLLDRYGVACPATADAAAVAGGFSQAYPVLKAMEEAGTLLRGTFVEGLGPLQFASSDTVEALREARDGAEGAQTLTNNRDLRVLSSQDPGQPFGILLAWPPSAERPKRLADSWTVFAGGTPVLWAAGHLKSVALFGCEDVWGSAMKAVLDAMESRARAQGKSWALERIEVRSVNGGAIRESPLAPVLAELGFVPTPDGMRFYPRPF
ncbi:DEAD/DEAH box helicase [Atopobiaceae bacterium 24-176]